MRNQKKIHNFIHIVCVSVCMRVDVHECLRGNLLNAASRSGLAPNPDDDDATSPIGEQSCSS